MCVLIAWTKCGRWNIVLCSMNFWDGCDVVLIFEADQKKKKNVVVLRGVDYFQGEEKPSSLE